MIEATQYQLGIDKIVDINETLISKKRKYNRGRIVKQKPLFGMIKREGGSFI